MEQVSDLIQLSQFIGLPPGQTYGTGVKTVLNIPQAILGLHHSIGTLAAKRGSIKQFHVHERDLYQPLADILWALLPRGAVVDHEAVLKKLLKSATKTDLSIRRLESYRNPRLGDHDFAVLIEMKSVFFGESIAEKDLLADLEKLLACEQSYSAKCFFVLVGLKDDLAKGAADLSKFLLHNAIGPISISLPSGKTAWLLPSARYVGESPHIYVWTVSANKKFGPHASDYVYTVFQER